jgi:uncharacterized membrane protein
MSHQRIFHYIQRSDNVLIWLNVFFLMTLAFLPIPTRILGMYGDHQPAVIFYLGSLMITGIFIIALWWYATHDHRLVDKQLDDALIRHHMQRSLIAPIIFLLSFSLSFINSYLAEFSLLLIGVAIAIHEYLYRRIAVQQRKSAEGKRRVG